MPRLTKYQQGLQVAKNILWEGFREIYGPRPGGRGAQARWEAQWEKYQQENPL